METINAPMTVDIDDLNRYTYNGEDYDFNTGLQYLRARYYSTGTGNFISQDTYLGKIINPISRNRYTYAHNNPVMFIDPSGESVLLTLGVIALVGIVATVGGEHLEEKAEENYQEASSSIENYIKSYSEYASRVNSALQDERMNSSEKETQVESICDEARCMCEELAKACADMESAQNWATAGRYINGGGRIINGVMFTLAGGYIAIEGTAKTGGKFVGPALSVGTTILSFGYAELNAGLAQFGVFGDQREEVLRKADSTYGAAFSNISLDFGVGVGLDIESEILGLETGVNAGGHVDGYHVHWDYEHGLTDGQLYSFGVEYSDGYSIQYNNETYISFEAADGESVVMHDETDSLLGLVGYDKIEVGGDFYFIYGGSASASFELEDYLNDFVNIWR